MHVERHVYIIEFKMNILHDVQHESVPFPRVVAAAQRRKALAAQAAQAIEGGEDVRVVSNEQAIQSVCSRQISKYCLVLV